MKKVFRANLYFLIVMLLSIIMPYILAYIYKAVGLTDVRIVLMLNHFILFLIPAIIYVIVTKSNVKETFRLNKLHLKDALMILVIALVAYPLMGCFSLISMLFFENNVSNFMQSISSTPYPVLLLLMAVMPAVTEEITMRGVVLSGYNEKSAFKASLMIGLLFGIFHLDGQQFLYAAALGFVLAYLVRVTNSIFSSMLLHFTINGISVTLSTLLTNVPTSEAYSNVESQVDDLFNITFNEKLFIISSVAFVIIALGGLIFKLIKVIEKWNLERNMNSANGVITKEVESDEKIINVPFILTVIVYIIYMVIQSVYFS